MTTRHISIRPRRGLALLATTVAVAALATSAGAASWNSAKLATALETAVGSVSADCGYDTSQTFAASGDPSQYYLAPGGNAETTPTWTKSGGAAVATGKGILGTGSKVFVLPTGASVTSQAFCTTVTAPTVRFSVKDPGVPGAALRVDASWTDSGGKTTTIQIARIASAKAGIRLVDPILLIANLGSLLPSSEGTIDIQLRFTSAAGSWQVDDVYLDPFKFT